MGSGRISEVVGQRNSRWALPVAVDKLHGLFKLLLMG